MDPEHGDRLGYPRLAHAATSSGAIYRAHLHGSSGSPIMNRQGQVLAVTP